MLLSVSSLGSVIIDVNDTRLDAFFLRENTGPIQIDDYLTIQSQGCNFDDLGKMLDRWLNTCTIGHWCQGWDINRDLNVDLEDLAIINKYWPTTP